MQTKACAEHLITMSPKAGFEREWSWETDETYRPWYTASAMPDGISYMVITQGPSGGPGMAGYQSYEALLAQGAINGMPAAIEARVRAYAEQVLRGTRATLRWEIGMAEAGVPAAAALAYVSAAIDDQPVAVKVLHDDSAVLFDGSLVGGRVRLALVVGFGRPWRQPGARTAEREVEIACPAGSSTTVRVTVAADHTLGVTTTTR